MAWSKNIVALLAIGAASPVMASQSEMPTGAGAPEAPASARYCLRVEAATGSRLETVQCWTRAEWADAEVDVDQDWATEGVRVDA